MNADWNSMLTSKIEDAQKCWVISSWTFSRCEVSQVVVPRHNLADAFEKPRKLLHSFRDHVHRTEICAVESRYTGIQSLELLSPPGGPPVNRV